MISTDEGLHGPDYGPYWIGPDNKVLKRHVDKCVVESSSVRLIKSDNGCNLSDKKR